jgi:two-component system repressor protein LuxO
LARHFLARYADEEGKGFRELDSEVEAVFLGYEWPGNVRQLQNVIRNIVVLHNADRVKGQMLPPPLNNLSKNAVQPAVSTPVASTETMQSGPVSLKPLWLTEKEAIERAIEHCGGNIPRAAALLEGSPSTIYRKKQAWASERK